MDHQVQASARVTTAPESRKRVLIVDDDPTMARALSLYMSLEGFECSVANNGMSALNEIELFPPDAVILDIRLPVLDGFAVCSHLRNGIQDNETPVIVLTGLPSADWREDMYEAGANEFFTKPCDFSELLKAVRRSTGTSSLP